MTSSSDRSSTDPFAGATFSGRYRLDGLIGRGGMASVYRGEDLGLGRPVAVKVFAAMAEGIDDDARRRSETAILASLEHRALVRLYDAARDDASGREYLVMELVDGRDLRQTLRLGPLSTTDAAGLAADLAEALHVIHERGIVHRDVKPANVLLSPAHLPTRTWNGKLADFGIARLIDDARLTGTGLLVGTPGYLSPEQVIGAAPGTSADIYSLGLVLLEALTAETAFPGPAVEAAGARLARDPEIPDGLGTEWVALLRAMTAREPGDRPTALDVAMSANHLTSPSTPVPAAAAAPDADEPATLLLPVADTPAAALGASDTPTVALGASDTPTVAQTAADDAARTSAETDDAIAARAVATALLPAPSTSRRWVRPAIGGTLLAVIVVGGFLLLPPVIAGLTTPPTTPTDPMPSVPGELGVHLEQLDEAVTR